jgi:hypothetical protein
VVSDFDRLERLAERRGELLDAAAGILVPEAVTAR